MVNRVLNVAVLDAVLSRRLVNLHRHSVLRKDVRDVGPPYKFSCIRDEVGRRPPLYRDRRGTARVTHRPDLAVQIAGRPAAIEVELQRKTRARLVGILSMYAEHSDGDVGALYGVLYVCDRDDVADAVKRAAIDARLHPPAISFRTLHDVVEQARAAGRSCEGAAHAGRWAAR